MRSSVPDGTLLLVHCPELVQHLIPLLYVSKQELIIRLTVKRHIAVHALRVCSDVVHHLAGKETLLLRQRPSEHTLHIIRKLVVRKRADTLQRVLHRLAVRPVGEYRAFRIFASVTLLW